MRFAKKLIILLLALSTVLSVSVFASAQEASADITISYDSDSDKLAKEFDVTLSFTNNQSENIYGGGFAVCYDSNLLEFVSFDLQVEDECLWEAEIFFQTDGYVYISSFADLTQNSDMESCGIEPKKDLKVIVTFKSLAVGTAFVSVDEAIFALGETFNDVEFAPAETTIDIEYPAVLTGVSLSLGSGIRLTFSALIPEEYEGAQICFTQDLATSEGIIQDSPYYADAIATNSTGKYNEKILPKYDFSKGVMPSRLGDNIYGYVVYNGIAISATQNSSVLKYCNKVFQFGKALVPQYTDEQFAIFETLLCDLIKYGEATQKYDKYNLSSIVTDSVIDNYTLKPTEFKPLESTDFKLTEGTITDPSLSGVFLSLGSNFRICYKVNSTDLSNAKIRVSYAQDGKNYYYYADNSKLNPTDVSGVYYLNVTPASTGIDFVYTVTVFDNEGTQGRSVDYSVKSYVYSMQGSTEPIGELVRNLYNYGKSVEKYDAATRQ